MSWSIPFLPRYVCYEDILFELTAREDAATMRKLSARVGYKLFEERGKGAFIRLRKVIQIAKGSPTSVYILLVLLRLSLLIKLTSIF